MGKGGRTGENAALGRGSGHAWELSAGSMGGRQGELGEASRAMNWQVIPGLAIKSVGHPWP